MCQRYTLSIPYCLWRENMCLHHTRRKLATRPFPMQRHLHSLPCRLHSPKYRQHLKLKSNYIYPQSMTNKPSCPYLFYKCQQRTLDKQYQWWSQIGRIQQRKRMPFEPPCQL